MTNNSDVSQFAFDSCRNFELPQGVVINVLCRIPLNRISSSSGAQMMLENTINATDSSSRVNVGITVNHKTPHTGTAMINADINSRSPIKSGHPVVFYTRDFANIHLVNFFFITEYSRQTNLSLDFL